MNYDAETQFIGLAINHPEFVLESVTPESFQYEDHQLLWAAMVGCKRDMRTLDRFALCDYIRRQGIEAAGIEEYILALAESSVIAPSSGGDYLRTILSDANARKLERGLREISQSDDDAATKRDRMLALARACELSAETDEKTVKAYIRENLDEIESLLDSDGLPGISTGIPRLDEITGGFRGSDLTVIAARPSVGKTALMVNIAQHAAMSGHSVGIVSAEQPGKQIIQRMLSITGKLRAASLRNPKSLDDSDWAKLSAAAKRLAELRIAINDKPSPSIAEVTAWATKQAGMEILFVDYLQRLRGSNRADSRIEQLGEIAMGLKELARTLDIPVIALAQINRQGAETPRMDHLKGSGDIEQEADMVAILHRDTRDDITQAGLVIDKNRHGPCGTVRLYFEPATMRFAEQDHVYEEAA